MGGVGCFIDKEWEAKIAKKSKSQDLIWIAVQDCLYIAIVYLRFLKNVEETLDEL